MKNQDFQLKVLIKQNTEMAIKLQAYRRDNQELTKKNESLNVSVQNLSQVFASLSAAWRTITDNQEALYSLMKKKSDNASKALVNKYINHFKVFDQIIANLGQKITNEGHSEGATIDAKHRLTSFVSNYNLFFTQFIQTYFKFNQEYISFLNERLQNSNPNANIKKIMTNELENRQKLKEFQSFVTQLKDNMKIYETHNKHILLDGLVLNKNKEIQTLKDLNMKQSRKIAYMTDYNVQNINKIMQEDIFECFCGGEKLKYFCKLIEQNMKKQSLKQSSKIQETSMLPQDQESNQNKSQRLIDLQLQNSLLMQRNVQALSKIEKIKVQNKLADETVFQSTVYMQLRAQFSQLLDYTNELTLKLSKNYDFINELEKSRLQEIQQLKKKYEKKDQIVSRSNLRQRNQPQQNKYMNSFKIQIESLLKDLKQYFSKMCQKFKERQESMSKLKEGLKSIKRENDELNKKLTDYQEKMAKNIQNLQYRYPKYNQVQEKVNQLLNKDSKGQQGKRIFDLWREYVDYVKNRDKKTKSLEEQLRKKDKEINQKTKVEDFLKKVLQETQASYLQNKQKFNKFSDFQTKIQKDIITVTEQNYKLKISVQQQRATTQSRLKNEIQTRTKMQEKMKTLSKIQEQIKLSKQKQIQLVEKFNEHMVIEKNKINKLSIQIKEMQKEKQSLMLINAEKDKNIEKAIEQKEKKNLEMNKMRSFLKAIEEKTEYEAIKMQMEQYKSKIMCACGAGRERSVVLKTCPHVFCKKCVDEMGNSRTRKCPICSVKFTKTDIHEINWS